MINLLSISRSLFIRPSIRWKTSRPLSLKTNQNDETYNKRATFENSTTKTKLSAEDTRRTGLFYSLTLGTLMFALTFAAVPLYRMYCQATGKGGQAVKESEDKIVNLQVDTSRPLSVKFVSSTHSSTPWRFEPVQDKIDIYPGQTALAFYRVTNPLDEPVIGVATYVVLPYEAGSYMNKIQCFCFEEQILQPHEDVFMPVLFYIDPEIVKDYRLAHLRDLTLSYTFFRSVDGDLIGLEEPIELKKH